MFGRRVGAVVLTAVAVTGLASSCTASKKQVPPQQKAARAFLDALAAGNATAAGAATTAPAAAGAAIAKSLSGLGHGATLTARVTGSGPASARFAATWRLPGVAAPWRYDATLPVRRVGTSWLVVWRTADLYPALATGEHLVIERQQPRRAALEDSAGRPLFAETPVVNVGIEKKLVTDLPSLARTLAAVPQLQSTAAEIVAAVRQAKPTDFVPVITLRRPAYEKIRSLIRNLPGTVFTEDTLLLPPSAHFAQPLLGTVGAATAQMIESSHGRLHDGDQTGIGGLQQGLDSTLAGTQGVTVAAARDDGSGTPRTLATVVGAEPGTPVRLTIDRSVQTAAEAALAKVALPATIVAVQRSTGRILADANTGAATYDLGLAGAFPAGSTFKIVTYTAAFTSKPSLTPSTSVACPPTTTVDGRHFENENKFSYPPIPVSAAFGYSCNTTAIDEAMSLPSDAMQTAARALGLGARWSLPVASFSGSLPAPSGRTERAADAIGQGRVQVSPLLMALIAGAATTGAPVRPAVVAGRPVERGAALPAGIVAKMTRLMRAPVELPNGTAHELAGLGGVQGKTGTAEYGNDVPPKSHSWFAGVRGDLAFAVFVYGGASAGVDAVPITRAFLSALH